MPSVSCVAWDAGADDDHHEGGGAGELGGRTCDERGAGRGRAGRGLRRRGGGYGVARSGLGGGRGLDPLGQVKQE